MQRDVLPMPHRPHEGLITYDAKGPNASFPPIEPLRPPAGAPNVGMGGNISGLITTVLMQVIFLVVRRRDRRSDEDFIPNG